MSKSNLHETNYLKLVYQNISIANIGNTGGLLKSTTDGSFYVTLYTVTPDEDDTGTEANYTSYTRKAVARSVSGWTIGTDGSGDAKITNAGIITFPTSTGGSNTISHFGIRTASSGGDLIHYGSIGTPLAINSGDTPKFEIDTLVIIEK